MSDDNKNLSDDLDDMLDNAKDGVKKAADKAEDLAGDAKEKAKEVYEDAKDAASDFADDAKEVLSDGKNVAIIAHITLIGLIIAFVMNSGDKKTEYGSYYIRQMLGISIVGIIISIIGMIVPILNILGLFTLILWVMSLIGSLSGEKKPVFLLGEQFQNWFKSL